MSQDVSVKTDSRLRRNRSVYESGTEKSVKEICIIPGRNPWILKQSRWILWHFGIDLHTFLYYLILHQQPWQRQKCRRNTPLSSFLRKSMDYYSEFTDGPGKGGTKLYRKLIVKMEGVTKADITEIKALASPPVLVPVVLSATALLLGMPEEQAKEWRYLKRLLGKADFLKQLSSIDINSIPTDTALKAKERSKDVEGDAVKKVSCACYGLHNWNQSVISAVLNNSDEQKTK